MSFHVRLLTRYLDRRAGSHAYDMELALHLAKSGHEVSVLCHDAMPEVEAYCHVIRFPTSEAEKLPFLWRLAFFLEQRHCSKTVAKMQLSRPDIVICTNHLLLKAHNRRFPATPFLYLPHSMVAPLEIESYGLPFTSRIPAKWLFSTLQLWALNNADCTIRFTETACDMLSSYYGSRIHPRFVVNRMGINIPSSNPRNHADVIRLLFVGRLIRSKNIDLLLSSLAKFNTIPWHLDIIGEGNNRDGLEKSVQSLDLSSRVSFHGFCNNLDEWYRKADLFVFPSLLENCPIVLLEAMSFGVPCLVFKPRVGVINANEEVVAHEKTGFLANDSDDFQLQLHRLIRHPEHLSQIGQEARKFVKKNHSWAQHLEKYEELFSQLVTKSRAPQPNATERQSFL